MSSDWSFFLRQQWVLAAENFLQRSGEQELCIGNTRIYISAKRKTFYVYFFVNNQWVSRFTAGSAERFVNELIHYIDTCLGGESIEDNLAELQKFFDDYEE